MLLWDLSFINLIFCFIILFYGLWVYEKNRSQAALLIGVAYGLFGLTRVAYLLQITWLHPSFLVVFRALAYLITLYALVVLAGKKK